MSWRAHPVLTDWASWGKALSLLTPWWVLFPRREAPDPELTCFLFLPGSKWAICRASVSGGEVQLLIHHQRHRIWVSRKCAFFPRSGVKEQVSGWQTRKEVGRGHDTTSASRLGAGKALLFRTCAGQVGEHLLRTGERAELGAGAFANLGQWRLLWDGGWGKLSPGQGWGCRGLGQGRAEAGAGLSEGRREESHWFYLDWLRKTLFSPRRNYSPTAHFLKTFNCSITYRKLCKPLGRAPWSPHNDLVSLDCQSTTDWVT